MFFNKETAFWESFPCLQTTNTEKEKALFDKIKIIQTFNFASGENYILCKAVVKAYWEKIWPIYGEKTKLPQRIIINNMVPNEL